MFSMETKNIGLRGIEIADTRISKIEGDKGKLIYRGYDILDLAKNSTFEETAYLLIYDDLPNKNQLDSFNVLFTFIQNLLFPMRVCMRIL